MNNRAISALCPRTPSHLRRPRIMGRTGETGQGGQGLVRVGDFTLTTETQDRLEIMQVVRVVRVLFDIIVHVRARYTISLSKIEYYKKYPDHPDQAMIPRGCALTGHPDHPDHPDRRRKG